MKKITQTGRIPINSIGLILVNYLKWFKVFFVFYVVPMIVMLASFLAINKEKLVTLFQNAISAYFTIQLAAGSQAAMGGASVTNTELTKVALEPVFNSLISIVRTPSFVILFLVSAIIMFICCTCLFVGLKHTFYKEVSIKSIAKEGFSKVFDFFWTGLSMSLLMVLIFGGASAFFISIFYAMGSPSIMLVLAMIVAYFVIISMFVFYVPIHFFSDNNPFSSAWLSFKTFWCNFGFMIVFGVVFGVISLLISLVLGVILFFITRHYLPMLPPMVLITLISNLFLPVIYGLFPYIGSGASVWWLNCIMIFVAYPELLDEDKTDGTTQISFNSNGGKYPSLPPEFFKDQDTQNNAAKSISSQGFVAQADIKVNSPALNDYEIKPTTGAEGLSVPSHNHQNNRPFLNQKLDQTEFDRLTSKDK